MQVYIAPSSQYHVWFGIEFINLLLKERVLLSICLFDYVMYSFIPVHRHWNNKYVD